MCTDKMDNGKILGHQLGYGLAKGQWINPSTHPHQPGYGFPEEEYDSFIQQLNKKILDFVNKHPDNIRLHKLDEAHMKPYDIVLWGANF